MAKSSALDALGGQLDSVVKPIITIILVIVVIFFAKKLLDDWRVRNVGRSGGANDGSNLATDVYLLDSVWVTPNKINEVCGVLLQLSDSELIMVYDKFKKLYGEKCPGGGVFCDDTTSMKVFLQEQSCHIAGCKNRDVIVQRLTSLGL